VVGSKREWWVLDVSGGCRGQCWMLKLNGGGQRHVVDAEAKEWWSVEVNGG